VLNELKNTLCCQTVALQVDARGAKLLKGWDIAIFDSIPGKFSRSIWQPTKTFFKHVDEACEGVPAEMYLLHSDFAHLPGT